MTMPETDHNGYSPIQTKYGRGTVIATHAQHIYFNANTNSASDETVGLTINGVRYGVSAHLTLKDGAWIIADVHALHIDRAQWRGKHADYSWAARRKAEQEIVRAVTEWAQQYPGALTAAQHNHIAEQIARRQEEIRTHEAAIANLRSEIAALRRDG